jgi:hypothetical protein
MKSRAPIGKFIEYFSKQLNPEQTDYLNQINKVIPERVELYRDFVISLCYLIHDSYLGDDTITDDEHVLVHFNWCWNTNIENFQKENINFQKNGEHYYYYFNYFTEIYYKNPEKNKILFDKIIDFWENVLSVIKLKTKSDYDIFIEVYKNQNKYFLNPLD